uniref:NADH-quinone oxidoreductase subunit C n=1 Tax=Fervidicoccus fontis TaxID=683846 RepID=A0A7J3ZLZ0_9CREN
MTASKASEVLSRGTIRGKDGALVINTTVEELVNVARELKELGYTHVVSITAIDYPQENKIVLVVHASLYEASDDRPKVVEIRTELNRESPVAPTLTGVWPSAEFQEREAYDHFGIVFDGHPDLRRVLLLEEDFKGVYPLRKDFVVPEEGIEYKEGWGELRG